MGNSQPPVKNETPLKTITKNDFSITLTSFHAHRDWMPRVERPGKDGGTPLMVFAGFKFDNTNSDYKDLFWFAHLFNHTTKTTHPIDLWDVDSETPWNGEIQPDEILKVRLLTRSGPYLSPGDKITLIIRFNFDRDEFLFETEPIHIMQTS